MISIEDVGRNEATTFAGFCSEHDQGIFKPIDLAQFDPNNPEHLFLATYRAVARELHAQMDGAWKIRGTYEKRVELGIDSGHEPTAAGMVAIEHFMRAYETYLYKCALDEALAQRRFEALSSHQFLIHHDEPTIAVSSHFSLDGVSRNGDPIRVTLNLLPLARAHSVVAFSYLPADSELVRCALDRLLLSEGWYQKYLLSKLILNHCENFVLSPRYVDRWSEDKRSTITAFFIETITTGKLEIENKDLFLF